MMKYYKIPHGLWTFLFAAAFLVLLSFSFNSFAQRTDSFEQGKLRIKVSEQLAQQLENASLKATANKIVLTGIQSIDNISQQFKVNGISRVFRPAGQFEARHRRYGLHLWYEIQMDKASSVLDALGAFKQVSLIEKTEPVFKKAIIGSENKNYGPRVVPTPTQSPTLSGASNDPFLGSQWHYNNTGQTGGTAGADIKLFQAWAIQTGRPEVIVAVTDGGIQVNHPDLAANIWVNTDEIPGNNIDDDDNGYIDDINGYGFGDNTGTIAPDQHGTHVGGTIAATTNNGVGVAGIAGGSGTGDGARLMSCAAFGANNSGGFAETYVYGADNGAVISQNSWGYTSPGVFEQAVLDGIDYFIAEAGKDNNGNQIGPMKGGIVIFAAGNDNNNSQHYPGFYAPTLSVSGTNHMDKKAWYSNFGDWVDIAAPGGETNTVSQQGVLSTLSNNQYGFFQGTSMATPHVSGVAALIVSAFGGPGLTPDMVRGRLVQTTDNIDAVNPGFEGLLGSGRLNAFAALQQNDHVAPDSIVDLSTIASTVTTISLTWTSPHDPGNGSASTYDIRYSIFPITPANFDSATAVVNPPPPSIAGEHDSLTVTGLAPGTTYYFAIKASDFFGNISALSNVVQQSTQFPPIISVTPGFVSDTLHTAESSTRSITISNTGQGPLTYLITNFDDSFVRPIPASDTIPQGQSRNITLALSANNLLAGDYSRRLIILSNDPTHDSTSVDVLLHVINNGLPIATVSPDSSINFGGVFVGGTVNRNIYIHNSGSETLRTWQTSIDGSDFSSDLFDTLYVAPFRDTVVHVRFTASALGTSTGAIHLATNDPLHAVFDITLRGEGLDAPAIVVSPDSLTETLHTDRTSTQQLTIQNTGGSDLLFSIQVKPKTTSTLVTKDITLPSQQTSASAANLKLSESRNKYTGTVQIKSVSQSSATARVLIVTPDSNVDDLKSILNSFSDIQAKVFPVDSLPVISLSYLTGYDVVMTTNNGQWQATGNVAPDVIGDLLADYIDQGGKVIVNQFAYSYDAWKMTGRFIEQQYGPFISSTADANIDVTLDSIATGNPIMQGVTTLDYSGFVQNVGLAPGATPLARWSNGDLFAAANSNVVALNILPSLGSGGALPWSGDLPTFYQNAIHWLSGPSFIKVSPSKGTVPAGSQANLDVLFDASSLSAGNYEASLDITNNVPGHELISIPAVLHVLGPEFTISPDSLAVALGKNESTTQTIVLTNNGSDNQPFTVRVQSKDGTSASSIKLVSLKTATTSSTFSTGRQQTQAVPKRDKAYSGPALSEGTQSIQTASGFAAARKSVAQNTTVTYATDFESFSAGDIDGQQGWEGQYGNWTIDSSDPASGTKHFHGLADGLGQSLSFSPVVSIGTENKSTTTMKINVQGSGVTWQVIPQSPSAGFLNTRVEFSADGSARALVSDGAGGGGYLPINAAVPSGYFDLTIEVDRDSATFNIFFNNDNVFHGLGFAGDIEQVVFLSLMEEAGPVLDVDNFQILDGARDTSPGYLTVSPVSGNIAAGESIALTATFNTAGLEFGKYHADVIVDISNLDELTVPTTLTVFGDPAIEVDPTVLQAVVGYREDTVKNFQIRNTGGNDLFYGLTVIGASTDMAKLPPNPVNKFSVKQSDAKVQQKIKKDQTQSRAFVKQQPAIELLSGSSLLEQGFDSLAFPPAGWSYTDNTGSGVAWNLASAWGEGNYSGVGDAATVSSDAFGEGEFDTELISPSINVGAYRNIVVQYTANYQNFANLDFLDLDIKVDGASWVNVLSWNEDHGTFRGLPGEFVSLNLDSYLAGASSFKLRWHYYDPNTGDFDWYAQIDNVVVLGDPKAWLTVNPTSGTVPVGGAANIAAHFYSQDLDPGFYVAGILVNSNATRNPLVGVVASLEVLNPAEIEVSPASVSQELFKGQTASQT
ncbi:MAG TPA: S8 family serine peptidase, partial [Cyclobacteriaceae bacterium]|nr:S8 family serine peptidase [Cyclobacteriaceae bacterium]